MTSRLIAALFCTSALSAFAVTHLAQAQSAAAAPAASGAGQLEEIVVTARKTEEKLQTAPVSVTALSAAKLDAQNVQTAQGLNGLVPNLNISQGSGYGTSVNVTIRGVVQADNVLTNDSPVALYIDGVYNARAMGGLFNLVDLERVEVLRGPQATLFGRNTTGGAINLVTRTPSHDFFIQQRLGYASNNEFETRTEINTGDIGDTGLRALLSYDHHQMDGWVHNPSVKDEDGPGSLDANSYYFALRGDLTDDLSFDYKLDYTNQRDQGPLDQVTAASPADKAYFGASPLFGGAPFVISPTRLDTVNTYNQNPPNHDEVFGSAITINYDVNDLLHLKNIAAYRSFASDAHIDQSGQGLLLGPVLNTATGAVSIQQVSPFTTLCPGNTPVLASNICDHQRQYQISEEFQASGTWNEFRYIGGLYFFDEKAHEQDPEFLTVVLPAASLGFPAGSLAATGGNIGINSYPVANYFTESKSFAAYETAYYKPEFLDNKFEFASGLRYTFDQKTIQLRDFDGQTGLASDFYNGAKNFHNISWLLSANYQFTDDIMGYWRIANAYKSGGFSARTAGNSYNPEVDTSYEFGLKTEFLDNRVRINADVFYTKYENLQVNVFKTSATGAAASETDNAGAATYKGGELEVSVIPAKGFLIDGSFGYTDPNYQQYLTDVGGKTVNLADQALFNYVSKMTYNLGVQYDFEPFTFGDLTLRADYSFASPQVFHPLTSVSPLNEVIKSQNYHNLSAYVILKNIETAYGSWEAKVYRSEEEGL